MASRTAEIRWERRVAEVLDGLRPGPCYDQVGHVELLRRFVIVVHCPANSS